MLAASTIIPSSTSQYSSPVQFLVKKQDETWYRCVNYQALNNITIKDKFLTQNIHTTIASTNNADPDREYSHDNSIVTLVYKLPYKNSNQKRNPNLENITYQASHVSAN